MLDQYTYYTRRFTFYVIFSATEAMLYHDLSLSVVINATRATADIYVKVRSLYRCCFVNYSSKEGFPSLDVNCTLNFTVLHS